MPLLRRLFPAVPLLLSGALGACSGLAGPAGLAPRARPLAVELDSIFADTSLAHAHWGVLVRSLESGRTLYALNPEKLFIPASNMKLITGAAALETLGPEYRYRTEVSAAGPVRDGVLMGDLVVRGSGDPTFSTRFADEPAAVFRAWADSLRAHGVTRIAGRIIGVDSAFADPPVGRGWAWDDLDASYSAEFGALQFNEGVVEVQVYPAASVDSPAVVVLDPPTLYVPIMNRTVTAAPGTGSRIRLDREPVGPGLIVSGHIAADTALVERSAAVRDPTAYFLAVLRETLRDAGVAVEGVAVDADDLPPEDPAIRGAAPLFAHYSPPLGEILPGMMKPSQNWIAETLLRTVGLEARGEGTAEAAEAVIDSLFLLWGLEPDEARIADGSGLSRYNLLSPDLLADLLTRMTRSPNWETWYASLPVAGVDGTLERRLRGTPLEGNVHAKTGTLSGVRALSGYLTTASGDPLVFSILVNHHVRSAADADRIVDAALLEIGSRE